MQALIPLLLLAVLVWLLFIRPSGRKQRAHAAMQDEVVVGDEIITAGGIHGEVVGDDGEIVQVRIAPAVVVDLDRRAIAAVARDEEPADWDDSDDERAVGEAEEATESR
jgi:preprotein translocase subunit YajC